MVELSEYLMTEVISVSLLSLVYSVKRTGAKTVPCSAPVDVQSLDESTDWKRTDWVLLSEKCTIQSVNLGSTCITFKCFYSILIYHCHMLSTFSLICLHTYFLSPHPSFLFLISLRINEHALVYMYIHTYARTPTWSAHAQSEAPVPA